MEGAQGSSTKNAFHRGNLNNDSALGSPEAEKRK